MSLSLKTRETWAFFTLSSLLYGLLGFTTWSRHPHSITETSEPAVVEKCSISGFSIKMRGAYPAIVPHSTGRVDELCGSSLQKLTSGASLSMELWRTLNSNALLCWRRECVYLIVGCFVGRGILIIEIEFSREESLT